MSYPPQAKRRLIITYQSPSSYRLRLCRFLNTRAEDLQQQEPYRPRW